MGNSSAVLFGLEKAHITVEESVSGLVKVVSFRRKNSFEEHFMGDLLTGIGEQIDNSTRKSTAGKFMVYDGTELPW
jgi:hypothetical protein